jgi:hypothetical protein
MNRGAEPRLTSRGSPRRRAGSAVGSCHTRRVYGVCLLVLRADQSLLLHEELKSHGIHVTVLPPASIEINSRDVRDSDGQERRAGFGEGQDG